MFYWEDKLEYGNNHYVGLVWYKNVLLEKFLDNLKTLRCFTSGHKLQTY